MYLEAAATKESAIAIVVAVETEMEAEADGASMGVVSEVTEVEVVVMVEVVGEVMEGRLIGASKTFKFTRKASQHCNLTVQ
jgi:hypothetical protein